MHGRLNALSMLVSLLVCHLITPPSSMVPLGLVWKAVMFNLVERMLPEASFPITALSLGVLNLASLSSPEDDDESTQDRLSEMTEAVPPLGAI